eukprot:1390706-Amphidinium_carterae.2
MTPVGGVLRPNPVQPAVQSKPKAVTPKIPIPLKASPTKARLPMPKRPLQTNVEDELPSWAKAAEPSQPAVAKATDKPVLVTKPVAPTEWVDQPEPHTWQPFASMEEEHRAFHDAIDEGIRRSIEAKAKAEPAPVAISQLPVERAEQVVQNYITEATERLEILMKLNGTVPAVNLLARVPMDNVDNVRPNAKVRVRRTTRKQQRRFAQAKMVTKSVLQSEYYSDLKVLEAMIQQIKAVSP